MIHIIAVVRVCTPCALLCLVVFSVSVIHGGSRFAGQAVYALAEWDMTRFLLTVHVLCIVQEQFLTLLDVVGMIASACVYCICRLQVGPSRCVMHFHEGSSMFLPVQHMAYMGWMPGALCVVGIVVVFRCSCPRSFFSFGAC